MHLIPQSVGAVLRLLHRVRCFGAASALLLLHPLPELPGGRPDEVEAAGEHRAESLEAVQEELDGNVGRAVGAKGDLRHLERAVEPVGDGQGEEALFGGVVAPPERGSHDADVRGVVGVEDDEDVAPLVTEVDVAVVVDAGAEALALEPFEDGGPVKPEPAAGPGRPGWRRRGRREWGSRA